MAHTQSLIAIDGLLLLQEQRFETIADDVVGDSGEPSGSW